jgi:hypothetical protein
MPVHLSLQQYLDEYPKVFIVGADNVGSRQMQKIRISLRGHAGKIALHSMLVVTCSSLTDESSMILI